MGELQDQPGGQPAQHREQPQKCVSKSTQFLTQFKLGRQEDSHEYLRYLVEGLQNAETGKLGKNRDKNERIIAHTLMYRVFGGKLRTCVVCAGCHHKSLTEERYYDLNIVTIIIT